MSKLITTIRTSASLLLLAIWAGVLCLPATAQLPNDEPEAAKGIGVDPKLGDFLELDTRFHDEQNNYVRLGDYFDGKRPVILSFNYSNCPKLCSVQLELMTDVFRLVDFEVNKDFQMISISIDPLEQSPRLRETKELYTKMYNRPGSEDGWHFLSGSKNAIKFTTDSCGVKYKYIPRQKLYSHPAVFVLLSPKGKIVRYIHGLQYDPTTIERALIESAEGKIGSPINRLSFVTGCFLFDESTGKYSLQAMQMMRIGGAITVFLLFVTLVPYWFFRRNSAPATNENTDKIESAVAGTT